MVAEVMGKAWGSCKGKGGSMHIAGVDEGMPGTSGIGTLAVVIGQIATVSTG
jgi:pyruvate dehydrogenase E1 component alpha subunit